MSLLQRVRGNIPRNRGQTMTEYSLILATVAVVIVAFYNTAGTIVNELVNKVGPLL